MTLWHETSGQGDALLLIHGWGMNAAVWEPVLERLTSSYRVTRIELPGHGFSQASESLRSLKDWVDAVVAVVPDNAVWVGWSLGGLISLKAALDHPEKLRALYMLNATPCFAQKPDWQCAMPVKTLQQFARNLDEDVDGTLMRFLSLQIQGCDNARELLKQLRAGFSARPVATDTALKTGFGLLQNQDLRTELNQLQLPLHWMFGEKDTLVPSCVEEHIALHSGQTKSVIRRAGHVPFLSHQEDFLTSLQQLNERSR